MKAKGIVGLMLMCLLLASTFACGGEGGTAATPTPTPTLAPTPTPAVTPTVIPSAGTGVEFASCDKFELTTAYQDMLSVQLTAPSSGYVVLTASGYVVLHVTGSGAWAAISISTVSGRANTENETRIEFGEYLSGGRTIPFSFTSVIPVSSGDTSFYMVGYRDRYSRFIWVHNLKLTAVFVPARP